MRTNGLSTQQGIHFVLAFHFRFALYLLVGSVIFIFMLKFHLSLALYSIFHVYTILFVNVLHFFFFFILVSVLFNCFLLSLCLLLTLYYYLRVACALKICKYPEKHFFLSLVEGEHKLWKYFVFQLWLI